MAKVFQVDTGSTLTTGLLGYWKKEDATEFYNGYTVTNNGAVTFVAGKVNNTANYVAGSSQYLSTTNTGLDTFTNFSMAFWLKVANVTTQQVIMCKDALSKSVFFFQIMSAGNFRMQASANGTSYPTPVDVAHGLTNNTWEHIVVTYAGATGAFNYYENTTGMGGGNSATGPHNNTCPIEFGAVTQYSEYFSGNLDEVGFWNKILSSTEISDLYNGGSGQTMIEQGAGGTVVFTPRVIMF